MMYDIICAGIGMRRRCSSADGHAETRNRREREKKKILFTHTKSRNASISSYFCARVGFEVEVIFFFFSYINNGDKQHAVVAGKNLRSHADEK